MPTQRTVIVLGAGASYEFGLPVGDQNVSGAIIEAAQQNNASPLSYFKAAANVAAAMPLQLSIDNYLHNHNGDAVTELCGKLAIVTAILAAESNSKLNKLGAEKINFANCKEVWAVRFAQILVEQCSKEELRKRLSHLTFIIFNYDRCVEHFLVDALMLSYNIDYAEACDIVNEISIYHPYGTAGQLPWMKSPDVEVVEFGGEVNSSQLLKIAKGIKTFTEGTDHQDSNILAIRNSIQKAERILFLGYAYHPLNMSLLLGDDETATSVERRVFGTALGMSLDDRNDINKMINYRMGGIGTRVELTTCYKILFEHSRELSFI